MNIRVKARIFSGAVCEQYVFTASDRTENLRNAAPRPPRFHDELERKEYNRKKQLRHFIRIVNQNFSYKSCYSTLTLDANHEIHDFKTAFREFSNFTKRLKRKFPDARIVWVMGRGKSTHRIHFHMLSDGIPPEFIKTKWGMGDVARIENLRKHNHNENGVDCGQDYTALAKYLFRHWSPEQGGHYWHGTTRTLLQPLREPAKPIKRNYTEVKPPPCPKGFVFVESKATQYGYLYYKYVRAPEKRKPGRPKKHTMANTG